MKGHRALKQDKQGGKMVLESGKNQNTDPGENPGVECLMTDLARCRPEDPDDLKVPMELAYHICLG